jgi:1-deoxy-D-xylulose-5-phosphate reductoisomerase
MAGGRLVMASARRRGVEIVPVDSEHTAIWQCLLGHSREDVLKLLLTASGGRSVRGMRKNPRSFRRKRRSAPKTGMGRKITVDSATMMNRGLRSSRPSSLRHAGESIEVVVHPQSIVHSAVSTGTAA